MLCSSRTTCRVWYAGSCGSAFNDQPSSCDILFCSRPTNSRLPCCSSKSATVVHVSTNAARKDFHVFERHIVTLNTECEHHTAASRGSQLSSSVVHQTKEHNNEKKRKNKTQRKNDGCSVTRTRVARFGTRRAKSFTMGTSRNHNPLCAQ